MYGLAVGARRHESQLLLGGTGEELGQHAVGLVQQVLGEVVARVDEPRLQAAAHPVHDRPAGWRVALFESQQVDIQDLGGHEPNASGARTTVLAAVGPSTVRRRRWSDGLAIAGPSPSRTAACTTVTPGPAMT